MVVPAIRPQTFRLMRVNNNLANHFGQKPGSLSSSFRFEFMFLELVINDYKFCVEIIQNANSKMQNAKFGFFLGVNFFERHHIC